MKLEIIRKAAQEIKFAIGQYCERIEIAGSIRRKRPECNDIEIVCIPKRYTQETGLFGEKETYPDGDFCRIINGYKKIKGEPTGKYTQRLAADDETKIDIFITTADNWGNILAIRTGSAEFSYRVLATGWVKKGYVSKDGFLYKGNEKIILREEIDLFNLLGLEYIEPEAREII